MSSINSQARNKEPTTSSKEPLVSNVELAIQNVTKDPTTVLTEAERFGISVTDNIATFAGRAILGTTGTGMIAGSVVGIVAVDVVRSAISSGKSERGVSDDDSYSFGDFSRGVIRNIKQLPNLCMNATEFLGQYTDDNRSRLAGAGFSGLGMVVGSVLAGYVGVMTGGFFGGLIGSKAVESSDDDEESFVITNPNETLDSIADAIIEKLSPSTPGLVVSDERLKYN